ncbi:MAG: NAD(P)H-hydrate dehydratase [Pseudomonadales bacterium]|nr:NAD(P)H-hydrate dehydratase [Pseudomonadales bacterium]
MDKQIQSYLKRIKLPRPDSHKGQNGKLMIIGGSELFHAASKWSLDVASKFVDMVFYASVPSNNRLVEEAKGAFWNGIVVPRQDIESYIDEADCVLIGPGMTRNPPKHSSPDETSGDPLTKGSKTTEKWNEDTEFVVNYLLEKYPDKKWVVDAGALQMVNPELLHKNCIVTPHEGEVRTLFTKLPETWEWKDFGHDITSTSDTFFPVNLSAATGMSGDLQGATVVIKGVIDYVAQMDGSVYITGGNSGMTKGGTGDVLAGLIAALYCKHHPKTAAVVGSYINKKAGDNLYAQKGPYFNASDLVEEVPRALWQALSSLKSS